MSIAADVMVWGSLPFRHAFECNLARVRGRRLVVYTRKQYNITRDETRIDNTLALWHGPAEEAKKRNDSSIVTIVKGGHEVYLKCCRNSQIVTLEEWREKHE